jgi:polyisoprenoid-binding protein YceI
MTAKVRQAALLFLSLSLAPILHAQQKLTLDPAHSEIHFALGGTLHTVHGAFRLKQGEIDLSPSTSKLSGNIIVDAASGQSGNSDRDRRMTDDVLKASDFKTVAFSPTQFTGAFNPSGDSTLTVHGRFTILGNTHEIGVPMKVHVAGNQFQAAGSFTVPYVQWGLKDPSNFMLHVNKEVQIDLSLAGSLQN